MWLKACPRCRGDLMLEEALGERSVGCLQCGHTLNQVQEAALPPMRASRRVVARAQAPLRPTRAA